MTYLSRTFWSSLSKSSGTYIYRGYGTAVAASGKDKSGLTSRRASSSSQQSGREALRRHHSREASGSQRGHARTTSTEAIVNNAAQSIGQAAKDLGADVKEANGATDHELAMEEEVAPLVSPTERHMKPLTGIRSTRVRMNGHVLTSCWSSMGSDSSLQHSTNHTTLSTRAISSDRVYGEECQLPYDTQI